jgi:hypothetical protein
MFQLCHEFRCRTSPHIPLASSSLCSFPRTCLPLVSLLIHKQKQHPVSSSSAAGACALCPSVHSPQYSQK